MSDRAPFAATSPIELLVLRILTCSHQKSLYGRFDSSSYKTFDLLCLGFDASVDASVDADCRGIISPSETLEGDLIKQGPGIV